MFNKGTTNHPPVMFFLRELFWLSAIYSFRFITTYIQGQLNTTTDAIFCLHQPAKALVFYSHLLELQPNQQVLSTPLACHMCSYSAIFLNSFQAHRTVI